MDTRDKSSTTAASAGSPPRHGRFRHPTLDSQITASLLDRLLHRGIVVAIDGPSYQMRAQQQRTEQLRKAITAGTP